MFEVKTSMAIVIESKLYIYIYIYIYIFIIRVFCPRAGPSLQVQEPWLQFCRMQVFHRKLRTQGCSFTRDWIDAVASRCSPHPLSFSICTDLIRSEKILGAPTWRWGESIWLTGPSRLHLNSLRGYLSAPSKRSRWVWNGVHPSGTGSTQPREDNWVVIWYEK